MTSMRADHLTRFQPKPDALARQPVSVFLPKDLDAIVRSLPNRSHWLRRIIAEAAQRELMPPHSLQQPNEQDHATETHQ